MKICIMGLGFVGLPMLECFYRDTTHDLIGFDVDLNKLSQRNFDMSRVLFTSNETDLSMADVIIVCVPTGLKDWQPDFSCVEKAAKSISRYANDNALVILESTVTPGTTEDFFAEVCKGGKPRFNFGYSSERINPGDTQHTMRNTTKLVSGEDFETRKRVAELYSELCDEVFECASIKVCESAKLVENLQRMINIGFMNQLAIDMPKLGVNLSDVLDACRTKWNWMNFSPGLVRGHCLPINPFYYLDGIEEGQNHIVRAASQCNESLVSHTVTEIHNRTQLSDSMLLLGTAYKPEVPDNRHDLSTEIAQGLRRLGHIVEIEDYVCGESSNRADFDAIILATAHKEYTMNYINRRAGSKCKVFDLTSSCPRFSSHKISYWRLGDG